LSGELAQVLAQCAASPDDDGPRLVWADLVGGERGELVVIQCDLARGGLTPSETAARRRREHELLLASGVTWAGTLADRAVEWRFRRGFIEAARFERSTPIDGVEHPLLSALSVAGGRVPALANPLHGLYLEGPVANTWPTQQLRSFGMHRLDERSLSMVLEVLEQAPIEQLWLRDHLLDDDAIDRVLAAAPLLTALELMTADVRVAIARLGDVPLRALRVGDLELRDLEMLAAMPGLEHLRFELAHGSPGLDAAFAGFPRLRTLELAGRANDDVLLALARRPLPSLRTLRIRSWASASAIHKVVEAYGPQLELLDLRGNREVSLDHASVAGEIVNDPYAWSFADAVDAELLHARADAMFERTTACFRRSAAFSIARMDTQRFVWNIPALPASRTLTISDHPRADFLIIMGEPTGTHAEIRWRDDHHELIDGGGVAKLRDGDEILLGSTILYYFTGPDASERARAAVTPRELDLSPLPAPPAAARVRIVDWEELVGMHGAVAAGWLVRELARQVVAELPGARVTFVAKDCFGLAPPEAAQRITLARFLDYKGQAIAMALRVE
jgi:hypothetical protein